MHTFCSAHIFGNAVYGYNYLNLINSQAGQKKDKVLVSLHRATSHDLEKAWSFICVCNLSNF